jgi:hypothetical protein
MRLRPPLLVLPALSAALLAAGSATVARYDASADIHAFLVSVRNGDRAAFDAHVDRPALKAQLHARLIAEAAASSGAQSASTAGALLAGPLVDVGVDLLARPEVFRAAAEVMGYGPDQPIPNMLVIGHEVKPLSGDRVCVMLDRRCSFVFRRVAGSCKLVAFVGELSSQSPRLKRAH